MFTTTPVLTRKSHSNAPQPKPVSRGITILLYATPKSSITYIPLGPIPLEWCPEHQAWPRCRITTVPTMGIRAPGVCQGQGESKAPVEPHQAPPPQSFPPFRQPLCCLRAGTSGVDALRQHKAELRGIWAAIFPAPLLTNKLLGAGDGEASAAAVAPPCTSPVPCQLACPTQPPSPPSPPIRCVPNRLLWVAQRCHP